MSTYTVRISKFPEGSGQHTGLVESYAVVDWPDAFVAMFGADIAAKHSPPVAIFPVNGDTLRDSRAREAARALATFLNNN